MRANEVLTDKDYSGKKRRMRIWKRVVAALSCAVVFSTTYMLILPALTEEQTTYCGHEEHQHDDACYEKQLRCELDDTPHVHTDACYQEEQVLVCGKEESTGHTHAADCIQQEQILICTEDHEHTEACYQTEDTYICGMEEGEGAHTHGPECYQTEKSLICGQAEGETHVHTDACYEEVLTCQKEEHEHSLACFSDPNADVETQDVWEKTMADVELTGVWADDVIAIAQSQLGYEESTRNYTVMDDGSVKGYSRYGAWYGDPYGDWCAMFASFCLHYAGVDEDSMPIEASCPKWIEKLTMEGLYVAATDYLPMNGSLVFFDYESDGVADHVGLVEKAELDSSGNLASITTIEGNAGDKVARNTYDMQNTNAIIGYGILPEKPESTITATASDGTAVSISGAIPDGAQVEISPIVLTEDELNRYLNSSAEEAYAYDIKIIVDGTEWQPIKPLSVSITKPGFSLSEEEYLVVSHVDGDADAASEVPAEFIDNVNITFEASGFSTWIISKAAATAATENYTCDFLLTWDDIQNRPATFSVVSTCKDNGLHILEYSDDGGATWTEIARGSPSKNGQSVTLDASSGLPDLKSASVNRAYRARVTDNNGQNTKETSSTFTLTVLLDQVKSGFSDWVKNAYLTEYGGTAPKTVQALYNALAKYRTLKTVTISAEQRENGIYAKATVAEGGEFIYEWKYQDEDGSWTLLTEETTAEIDLSEIEVLQHGTKEIRCNIYQSTDTEKQELCGTSNTLSVNPRQEEYDQAIDAINQQLNLGDLSINGDKFTNYFYYGAVAKDSSVPFNNSEEYAEYLAKLYIEGGGITAAQTAWKHYLYDLYDPDVQVANSGDPTLYWPKAKIDSFHDRVSPVVKQLDYNFLDQGVDYSSFITDMDKTATAVAAGDENTDRKYNVDITTDVQAKAKAPVAMVLQIQTTWQMFDLEHANALAGTGDNTSVGACASNTELGTLYDIKHALLRFTEYMEKELPGNNLVLGITETRHGGTDSMFLGTGEKNSVLYVSNDPEILRQGIENWDIFGNCEHVHYGSKELENAVINLPDNLAHWKDMYGYQIKFDDIQKVAVIIGGPTENKNSDSGYKCVLPWDTFESAGLNSVYSIRTNNGTPLNSDGVISWLDIPDNNGSTAFCDGTGNGFTEKYVATNEDAIFNTLVQIAQQEMMKKGLPVTDPDKYVEDVTVTDTIEKEFVIDDAEPITATIYNQDGSVKETRNLTKADLNLTKNPDGTTTVTYNFGKTYNLTKCVLHFGVIAQEDYIGSNNVFTNVGTPGLTYIHKNIDDQGQWTGETENYSVRCFDTPQVNVPIRYETVDGDKVTVLKETTVDLGSLGEEIPKQAEELLDNYPQINGTLSYVWVMPDGTEKYIGDVSVKNGVPSDFPSISQDYTANSAGNKTGTLKLTFTPENVDSDNKNFSNDTTKTAVNPVTKSGNVWIDVRDPSEPYNLTVRKVWNGASTPPDSVQFRLLEHGKDTGTIYTLTKDDGWEKTIENLPSVVRVDGVDVAAEYTVEEIVPDGYQVYYSQDMLVVDNYAARAVFELSMKQDANNIVKVRVECVDIDGVTHYTELDVSGLKKNNGIYSFEIDNIPLDANGDLQNLTSYSIIAYSYDNGKKQYKVEDISNKIGTWTYTQSKYVSGSTSTPILIMTNTPDGYELPDTGGPGTTPFTLCGLGLMTMASALMYRYYVRRRRERRAE